MRLSFIGAGKVGTACAKYFSKHYEIQYFSSRSDASAQIAAHEVGCRVGSNEQVVNESDVIFITCGDNAIADVALAIKNFHVKDKLFVHMSGALSSEILQVLKQKGGHVCSVHPLQTFSDTKKAVEDLKNAYFSLEGDVEKVLPIIKTMGNPYLTLTKQQKTKYHLSACIFSNYLVTLMDFASRMLEDIGIEEEKGLEAMRPLIDATLSNIYSKGTQKSLTGPIQRGDTKTLEKHMSELKGLDLEAYQLLGKMTTKELIMDENKKSILDALWRQS